MTTIIEWKYWGRFAILIIYDINMIWVPLPKEDLEKLNRALYMYSIINPRTTNMWYKCKKRQEIDAITDYDSLWLIRKKKRVWIHKLEELRALTDSLYQENGFDKLEKMIRKKV